MILCKCSVFTYLIKDIYYRLYYERVLSSMATPLPTLSVITLDAQRMGNLMSYAPSGSRLLLSLLR